MRKSFGYEDVFPDKIKKLLKRRATVEILSAACYNISEKTCLQGFLSAVFKL